MKRVIAALLVTVLFGFGTRVGADADQGSLAILDKAIKALGGEEKLSMVKSATWKAKGTITFGDSDNPFTSQTTVQGFNHLRNEFEGDFNGNKVTGVTVLNGDKGWRKFGDNVMALDMDGVANEKRTVYLQVFPAIILPLKGKTCKVEAAGEEKVGGKATVAVKATGPDGKDFKLYFDKKSGLPVKQVARVVGFDGQEFTQETTFSNYKDFNGIKVATKMDSTRDGSKFVDREITEFRVLNKIDPKTFAEPE
jgi:hypothetical protein